MLGHSGVETGYCLYRCGCDGQGLEEAPNVKEIGSHVVSTAIRRTGLQEDRKFSAV